MNPFRYLRLLWNLRGTLRTIVSVIDDEQQAIRPMLHAINRRLAALEEVAPDSKPLACANCGALVDQTMRPNGPQVMERRADGERRMCIVCDQCEPYAKRNGWRVVKAVATPVIEQKQEAAS